ncbi:unnamed protein product [Discosporangium mesarthrocarpum]
MRRGPCSTGRGSSTRRSISPWWPRTYHNNAVGACDVPAHPPVD